MRRRSLITALLLASPMALANGGDLADPFSTKKPTTDTKTYCIVDGKHIEFTGALIDDLHRRQASGPVKCWQDGKVVVDAKLDHGKRTGFITSIDSRSTTLETYRDDKLDGEYKKTIEGKLAWVATYAAGAEVTRKELWPSGHTKRYSHKLPHSVASLSLSDDGRVQGLTCWPDVKDDAELKTYCGFGKATTTQIYDGTGKVRKVVTYKDGVIQAEGAGTSSYASGEAVAYKDGKKQGEERVVSSTGTLKTTIQWNQGQKDGPERTYDATGKKVVAEQVWSHDVLKSKRELYLNGNDKLRETYDSPTHMTRIELWDSGKTQAEGAFVREGHPVFAGGPPQYREWQEDGLHKSFYESGARESEVQWKNGKREGTAKRWWKNGKQASVEEYSKDVRTKAKAWDEAGTQTLDEEYEADGSRKRK